MTIKKRLSFILASAVLVVGYLGADALSVFAATTPPATVNSTGQALEIAPPLIYLTVNRGQTISTQIDIRDISSGNLVVTGQVNDFVAAGESGAPKILLNGSDVNDPYTLQSWIQGLPSLNLVPRQIKTLPVTINVPNNASPGGHYGVIRFTATAPSVQGGSGVSLAASIGVLMLLTVNGNITHNLSVQSFTVNHGGKAGSIFQSGPLTFVEQLKNTGNVHEQPVGQVTVTDMFGKKIGAVNVNLPPGNVLPSSTREFSQSLDSSVIGNKRLFGHYTAQLSVTYANNKVLKDSISFWVIPYTAVAIIILLLIAVFFVLRYLIKRYNRRVLEQARKQRHSEPEESDRHRDHPRDNNHDQTPQAGPGNDQTPR